MATVSVLGLGHLSALQASGGESMRGARRQTSRLSASAVGIPGTPRLSTERKQGPQESKRDPPPPAHRAAFTATLSQSPRSAHYQIRWGAYRPREVRVSFPFFRGRHHLVHGPPGSSRTSTGSQVGPLSPVLLCQIILLSAGSFGVKIPASPATPSRPVVLPHGETAVQAASRRPTVGCAGVCERERPGPRCRRGGCGRSVPGQGAVLALRLLEAFALLLPLPLHLHLHGHRVPAALRRRSGAGLKGGKATRLARREGRPARGGWTRFQFLRSDLETRRDSVNFVKSRLPFSRV